MTEEAKSPRQTSRRRIAWMLFLLLNALFVLTSTGRIHTQDENMTELTVVNLVERGTTELAPEQLPNGLFFGRYDVQGKPRPAYGFGQAAFLAPWYLAGKAVAAMVPAISTAAANAVIIFFVVLSSATFAAAAAALAFLLFSRFGIPLRESLVAAFVLALGTQLFAYSAWMFSESLIAFLMVAAALICFGDAAAGAITPRKAVWAGLLLGTAVLVRPTTVVLVAVFGAAVLISSRRSGVRPALLLMSMAGLVSTLLLAYNSAVFGSPLQFGYPDVIENQPAVGLLQNPLWVGLRGFLLTPGKSIFIFSPPVIAALVALPGSWRRNRGLAALAAGAPLVSLLFFSFTTYWEGGFCYGPRYMLPASTLLCLGLGCYFADATRRQRILGYGLALIGFAVQIVGIAIDYVEPARLGGYYDPHWKYRLEYNAILLHLRTIAEYWSGDGSTLTWDRWWVFLTANGIPASVVAAMFAGVALTAIIAAVALCRRYQEGRREEASGGSLGLASAPAR